MLCDSLFFSYIIKLIVIFFLFYILKVLINVKRFFSLVSLLINQHTITENYKFEFTFFSTEF